MAINVYDKIAVAGQPKMLAPELVWRDTTYTTGFERFEITQDLLPIQTFDWRGEAQVSQINDDLSVVSLGGYNAPGDRGGGLYKAIATPSPAKLWHFQSADGRWWELVPGLEMMVQQFGARGDVVTNDAGGFVSAGTVDTPAFNAATEYSRLKGCGIHVPGGKYRLNADWIINCTDDPLGVMWPTKYRFTIRGDGERATFLFFDAGVDIEGIQYIGRGSGISGPSLEHMSQTLLSDMSIIKKSGKTGTGLYLQDHFHCIVRNVCVMQWDVGFQFRDVHLSNFENMKVLFNNYGGFIDKMDDTQPNAISFRSCDISSNTNNALDLTNISEVMFDGCDFNSNGLGGLDDTKRWGVRIRYDATPIEGVVAATFLNCRFEGTDADTYADIYYLNPFYNGVVNVIGTDFLRDGGFGTPANQRWAKYNVLMDGSGDHRHVLNLIGSAFIGFNLYVPSTVRRNVWIADLTQDVRVTEIGCHFEHSEEFPIEAFSNGGRTRMLTNSARAVMADTAGTMTQSVNVLSIIKASTGLYNVLFRLPVIDSNFGVSFTALGASIRFFAVTAQSFTGFSVQCWDLGGVAADTRFSFSGWWRLANLMPSKSAKQKRTMAAAAHNPAFAKKMGIPVGVAKEFNRADTKKGKKK